MNYKIGDMVQIKSWEEMLKDGTFVGTDDLENFEFGKIHFHQDGISFPEYAQYLCGRQFIISCEPRYFLMVIDGHCITENMVKPIYIKA